MSNGLFGRKANLLVSAGTRGLDLSKLRFRFEVRATDCETPNTVMVRVYNLSQTSAQSIIAEYDTVTLQAGYENGNFGIIFKGDIKQFRRGRERNVDTYLDILAGDGDKAYNQSTINLSVAPGTSDEAFLDQLIAATGLTADPSVDQALSVGGVLLNPRGKVAWGLARLHMRGIALNYDSRWSIQNGTVVMVKNTGYLPGQVVVMNSATGMIGTPEQTDNGIMVRCYLNPYIAVGQRIQINNADINQSVIKSQFFPTYQSQYFPASIASDGIYRVLVVEHVGDTRSNDFYSELTCLAIDPSSAPATSVLSNG